MPDTTTLKDQLNAFLKRKAHFAIVVDEYGEVMGLVTLEDIIEEIVGDITDETDIAAALAKPQADGSLIVDGMVPIRDVNRLMEWDIPDEEATTVAGLVIHEAQTIPEAGQAFTFHGFRFEVLRRQRNRHHRPCASRRSQTSAPRRRRRPKPRPREAGRERSSRRECGDGKRVDLAGELLGQHLIDHAVTLHARLAGEAGRHHFDGEMALAGSGRAGMAGMTMRVVDDFERLRRESLAQLLSDLHPQRASLCRRAPKTHNRSPYPSS